MGIFLMKVFTIGLSILVPRVVLKFWVLYQVMKILFDFSEILGLEKGSFLKVI